MKLGGINVLMTGLIRAAQSLWGHWRLHNFTVFIEKNDLFLVIYHPKNEVKLHWRLTSLDRSPVPKAYLLDSSINRIFML